MAHNIHKRVMFIAYEFPPTTSVGGAIRSEKFVNYLPNFSWDPQVLTCGWTGSAESDVHRLPSLIPFRKPFHLSPLGWIPSLIFQGSRLLRSKPFDLIYISCPPFPPALAALWLKRKFNLPLVIDYRDPWSFDPYSHKGSYLSRILHKSINPWIEAYLLSKVDHFIANTPSMLQEYLNLYPWLKDRITLITNGYDEADFKLSISSKSNDKLVFLYAGSLGVSGRDASLLLNSFKQLTSKAQDVHLKLLRKIPDEILYLCSKLNLNSHVTIVGPKPHKEAIHEMNQADVLLLYQEKSSSPITPVAGKTYEYLRSGKPILAIAPAGDNLDIINKYAARAETISNYSESSISYAMEILYQEWKNGTLGKDIMQEASKEFLKLFNRQTLSANLAQVFSNCVELHGQKSSDILAN